MKGLRYLGFSGGAGGGDWGGRVGGFAECIFVVPPVCFSAPLGLGGKPTPRFGNALKWRKNNFLAKKKRYTAERKQARIKIDHRLAFFLRSCEYIFRGNVYIGYRYFAL